MSKWKSINCDVNPEEGIELSNETSEAYESKLATRYEQNLRNQSKADRTKNVEHWELVRQEYLLILNEPLLQKVIKENESFCKQVAYLSLKNVANMESQVELYYGKSIQHFQMALALDDGDISVWQNMGLAAMRKLKYVLDRKVGHVYSFRVAKFAFENVLVKNAGHSIALNYLCRVLYVLQNDEQCMEMIEMLLALDPGNAMGRILLDRLHQDMANPISTSSNAYVAHDDYLDMASKSVLKAKKEISKLARLREKRKRNGKVPNQSFQLDAHTLVDASWRGLGLVLLEIKERLQEKNAICSSPKILIRLCDNAIVPYANIVDCTAMATGSGDKEPVASATIVDVDIEDEPIEETKDEQESVVQNKKRKRTAPLRVSQRTVDRLKAEGENFKIIPDKKSIEQQINHLIYSGIANTKNDPHEIEEPTIKYWWPLGDPSTSMARQTGDLALQPASVHECNQKNIGIRTGYNPNEGLEISHFLELHGTNAHRITDILIQYVEACAERYSIFLGDIHQILFWIERLLTRIHGCMVYPIRGSELPLSNEGQLFMAEIHFDFVSRGIDEAGKQIHLQMCNYYINSILLGDNEVVMSTSCDEIMNKNWAVRWYWLCGKVDAYTNNTVRAESQFATALDILKDDVLVLCNIKHMNVLSPTVIKFQLRQLGKINLVCMAKKEYLSAINEGKSGGYAAAYAHLASYYWDDQEKGQIVENFLHADELYKDLKDTLKADIASSSTVKMSNMQVLFGTCMELEQFHFLEIAITATFVALTTSYFSAKEMDIFRFSTLRYLLVQLYALSNKNAASFTFKFSREIGIYVSNNLLKIFRSKKLDKGVFEDVIDKIVQVCMITGQIDFAFSLVGSLCYAGSAQDVRTTLGEGLFSILLKSACEFVKRVNQQSCFIDWISQVKNVHKVQTLLSQWARILQFASNNKKITFLATGLANFTIAYHEMSLFSKECEVRLIDLVHRELGNLGSCTWLYQTPDENENGAPETSFLKYIISLLSLYSEDASLSIEIQTLTTTSLAKAYGCLYGRPFATKLDHTIPVVNRSLDPVPGPQLVKFVVQWQSQYKSQVSKGIFKALSFVAQTIQPATLSDLKNNPRLLAIAKFFQADSKPSNCNEFQEAKQLLNYLVENSPPDDSIIQKSTMAKFFYFLGNAYPLQNISGKYDSEQVFRKFHECSLKKIEYHQMVLFYDTFNIKSWQNIVQLLYELVISISECTEYHLLKTGYTEIDLPAQSLASESSYTAIHAYKLVISSRNNSTSLEPTSDAVTFTSCNSVTAASIFRNFILQAISVMQCISTYSDSITGTTYLEAQKAVINTMEACGFLCYHELRFNVQKKHSESYVLAVQRSQKFFLRTLEMLRKLRCDGATQQWMHDMEYRACFMLGKLGMKVFNWETSACTVTSILSHFKRCMDIVFDPSCNRYSIAMYKYTSARIKAMTAEVRGKTAPTNDVAAACSTFISTKNNESVEVIVIDSADADNSPASATLFLKILENCFESLDKLISTKPMFWRAKLRLMNSIYQLKQPSYLSHLKLSSRYLNHGINDMESTYITSTFPDIAQFAKDFWGTTDRTASSLLSDSLEVLSINKLWQHYQHPMCYDEFRLKSFHLYLQLVIRNFVPSFTTPNILKSPLLCKIQVIVSQIQASLEHRPIISELLQLSVEARSVMLAMQLLFFHKRPFDIEYITMSHGSLAFARELHNQCTNYKIHMEDSKTLKLYTQKLIVISYALFSRCKSQDTGDFLSYFFQAKPNQIYQQMIMGIDIEYELNNLLEMHRSQNLRTWRQPLLSTSSGSSSTFNIMSVEWQELLRLIQSTQFHLSS